MTESSPWALREFWKVPEFARHLNLAPRTLWAAIAAGELAVVRFGRRATRIERAEAERFIAAARYAKGR